MNNIATTTTKIAITEISLTTKATKTLALLTCAKLIILIVK